MSETGGLDLMGVQGAAQEGQEQSQEQFREQMRQAQAALAQLKKDEGKAKAQDDRVAKVIVQFLGQPQNTDLFLLISRCVAQNIPSELILAVLALIDQDSYRETEKFLQSPEGLEVHSSSALVAASRQHLQSLSAEQRQMVDLWLGHIFQVASKRPHRCLEALVSFRSVKDDSGERRTVREIAPPFVQLSAFIMRRFFSMQELSVEFEELHGFMQASCVRLVRHLEDLLKELMPLPEGIQEAEGE